MRHAERQPNRDHCQEADLELTSFGEDQVGDVGHQLRAKIGSHISIDLILASPHRAACQTAERLRDLLELKTPVSIEKTLDPDFGPDHRDVAPIATRLDTILKKGKAACVLIVGHQALLGVLGRRLTTQYFRPPRCGIGCIEVVRNGGTMLWQIQPRASNANEGRAVTPTGHTSVPEDALQEILEIVQQSIPAMDSDAVSRQRRLIATQWLRELCTKMHDWNLQFVERIKSYPGLKASKKPEECRTFFDNLLEY